MTKQFLTVAILSTVILTMLQVDLVAQDSRRFFPKEEVKPATLPLKENVWVFILAGQSNMAGRGVVEPQDTIPDDRILTINSKNEIIIAKEPLHFYEPSRTGLDCGMSFAKALLQKIPEQISLLLIPTAVGGSSTRQWLGDSLHREVKLMSNFVQRVAVGKKYGTIKGILWHQGEADANERDVPQFRQRITELFTMLRQVTGDKTLPILIGELGSYSGNNNWTKINEELKAYSQKHRNSRVIATGDLKPIQDNIHFNSEGQRMLGQRYAEAFLEMQQ